MEIEPMPLIGDNLNYRLPDDHPLKLMLDKIAEEKPEIRYTTGMCWSEPDPNYVPPPRRFYCDCCRKEYKTNQHLAFVDCEDDDTGGIYLCKACWKMIGNKWK